MRPTPSLERSADGLLRDPTRTGFWTRWTVANSLAELIGLGTTATVDLVVARRFGEPQGLQHALAFALLFVILGAFEGLVVGIAQARVLRTQLPQVRGWVPATVVGAVVSWAVGMTPSTLMGLREASTPGPPPEIGEPLRLLLAAGLGLVAGPMLAFFQWLRLREVVARGAIWWMPANAAAWALGMPVIFIGAHLAAITSSAIVIAGGVALSLLIAGAVVGAVHGRVLVWLAFPVQSRAGAA